MAGERVLVIDSTHRDVRFLTDELLRPAGYVVTHAATGVNGLRVGLRWKPDLIFVDHLTQQRSGVDISAQLREAGQPVPCILVGTTEDPSVLRWALRMGAVDYLVKPYNLQEAAAAIDRALGQKTLPQSAAGRVPQVEQTDSHQQLAQRVRELCTLQGIGKAVTSIRGLDTLLNRIVEAAVYLSKAEEGFLLLLDKESNELYLRAGQGLGNKFAKGFRVKSTDSVVWRVLKTGEPAMITRRREDGDIKIKTGYLVHALLHVPLKVRGNVIGVLSAHNRLVRRSFSEKDQDMLLALADYAAIAIDNARQYEMMASETARLSRLLTEQTGHAPRLQEQIEKLSRLNDASKVMIAVRDLDELLACVVELAVNLTQAEEGFLLLLDEESNELYLRAGQGLGKGFAKGFRVKSTDSILWQVVETGEPVVIGSRPDEERLQVKTGYLVYAMLHVPLQIDETTIGVLSVDNKTSRRNFSDQDVQLLVALADLAAISIEKMRFFQSIHAHPRDTDGVPEPASGEIPVAPPKETPLDWVTQELKSQQGTVIKGLRDAERLTREMSAHIKAVEELADGWRSHQSEIQQMARRLASARDLSVTGWGEILAANLTEMTAALDELGAGLIVTDCDGIIKQANAVAGQLLLRDELLGLSLQEVCGAAEWAKSTIWQELDGRPADHPGQSDTFWSQGRLVKTVFVPLAGQEDKRWAIILRDLFRERSEKLVLQDLLAAIAQDVRTPLTILASYTDLLLAETVGLLVPAQQRLLEQMRTSIDAIGTTLNDPRVALPNRPYDGQSSLPAADVRGVLQDTLTDARGWLAERELDVRVELDESLPRVAAQSDCVHHMIANLLQNAAQATPDGGQIEISARVSNGDGAGDQPAYVSVSLSDQGAGIAPENLGRVFDDAGPGLAGTGVELSVAKTLAEAFGGRVWVETSAGVGSKFSFVLPAAATE